MKIKFNSFIFNTCEGGQNKAKGGRYTKIPIHFCITLLLLEGLFCSLFHSEISTRYIRIPTKSVQKHRKLGSAIHVEMFFQESCTAA